MARKLLLIMMLVLILPAKALTLTSESWREFALVGASYLCPNQGGDNMSPQLAWAEVPHETKSFLLFLHDPDAPHSAGFVHWVVYVNDPKIKSLDTGVNPTPTSGVVFGLNGADKNSYFGPCPPSGTGLHRYVFTLYALNTRLDSKKIEKLHQSELVNLLYGKVIKQATFTGFYRNTD